MYELFAATLQKKRRLRPDSHTETIVSIVSKIHNWQTGWRLSYISVLLFTSLTSFNLLPETSLTQNWYCNRYVTIFTCYLTSIEHLAEPHHDVIDL